MESNCNFFLLICFVLIFLVSVKHARAYEYTVGDVDGWNQGVNFFSWSQRYNFTTGDLLVFKYVKGEHDVYEVTGETYRSCDVDSGVKAVYSSGNDRVKLEEERQYWFLCNTDGHCKGGMRFGIKVESKRKSSRRREVPGSTALPPGSPPMASSGSGGRKIGLRWAWAVVVGLLKCTQFF